MKNTFLVLVAMILVIVCGCNTVPRLTQKQNTSHSIVFNNRTSYALIVYQNSALLTNQVVLPHQNLTLATHFVGVEEKVVIDLTAFDLFRSCTEHSSSVGKLHKTFHFGKNDNVQIVTIHDWNLH